ncbi:hypothetical protein HDA37_001619 [Pseudonocardia antarctica]|uniref:Uncharacterized protein n=1 Tax=Pseudonocardia alni TaxID=33907 RepID=A0A852W3F2_PSEA5|nr:hypothetical protein [Pseudonocardia antarctica]
MITPMPRPINDAAARTRRRVAFLHDTSTGTPPGRRPTPQRVHGDTIPAALAAFCGPCGQNRCEGPRRWCLGRQGAAQCVCAVRGGAADNRGELAA